MAKKIKSINDIPLYSEGVGQEMLDSNLLDINKANLLHSLPELKVEGMFPTQSKYDEGISYNLATTPGGIEQHRHEEQGVLTSFGAGLAQAAAEVVGGTIEGIGYLFDVEQYGNLAKGTEQEFGNWFSDLGKDLKTWTQEAAPVYTDPTKAGGFNPEDWTWWMSNLPSVASTLSLLIPASGVTKGLSMLGKAVGISSKLGKTVNFASKGITQAIVSRHMENMMEASQTMEETEKSLINSGIDAIKAKEEAAKAASQVYNTNWYMLAQDIPQYIFLSKTFDRASREVNAAIAKKAATGTAKTITKTAEKAGQKAALMATGKKTYGTLSEMLSEGGEESFQYIVSQRARELAEVRSGLRDERELSEAMLDYINDGEFWTSAVMGSLGAGVNIAGVGAIGKMQKHRTKNIETEESARLKDMDSWGGTMRMTRLAKEIAADGGFKGSEEFVNNTIISKQAVKSASVGNLDLFRQTIEAISNAPEEELSNWNLDKEDQANIKANKDNILKKINRVEELHNKNSRKYKNEFVDLITEEQINEENLLNSIKNRESNLNESIEGLANLDKLSSNGKEIFLNNNIYIPAKKAALKQLKQSISTAKEIREKEYLKNKAESLQKEINKLEDKTSMLISERNNEDTINDKKYEDKSQRVEETKSLAEGLEKDQLAHFISQEELSYITNEKNQEEMLQRLYKNSKKNARRNVQDATTPEEKVNVVKEAQGTENEQDVKDELEEEASNEDPNMSFGEEVTPQTFAQERYANKDGSVKSALFAKELGELIDHIGSKPFLDNFSKEELGYIEPFTSVIKEQVASPDDLDSIFETIDSELLKRGYEETAIKLYNGIFEYFNQVDSNLKETRNEEIKDSVGTSEMSNVNNEMVKDEEDKANKVKGGKFVFKVTGRGAKNFIALTGSESKGKYKHFDDIASNDLNTGEIPVGGTVNFEIDLFNSWTNLEDPDNCRIEIVYYKDGNSENKDRSNRKLIAIMPRSENMTEDGKEMRKNVIADAKTNTGDTIITTKYTSKIDGFIGYYSKSDTRHSPKEVAGENQLRFGLATVLNDSVFIQMPNGEAIPTSLPIQSAGSLYQILPNPYDPNDIIITRVFTKDFRKYSQDNPIESDKIRKSVLNLVLSEDLKDRQKVPSIVYGYMQKKGDVLIPMKYNLGDEVFIEDAKADRISFSGLKNSNPEDVAKFDVWLNDLPMQVDKDALNTSRWRGDFGTGSKSGNYNELINDRLESTINPRVYLQNTAPIISFNIQEGAIDTIIKSEEIINKKAEKVVINQVTEDPADKATEAEAALNLNSSYAKRMAERVGKEKTVDKKQAPKEIKTSVKGRGRNKLIDRAKGNQNKPKAKQKEEGEYTVWNKEEEITWFKKRFPDVPIEVLDDLKEIHRNGGKNAWGLFYNAAVYMATDARQGTTYHEAFHTVFNLFLNNKQRESLENEYKKIYPNTKNSEEGLADYFSEYIMAEQEKSGVWKKINDVLKKLWALIKGINKNRVYSIDELFFRLEQNMYIGPKADPDSFGSTVLRASKPDWSYKKIGSVVNSINSHILLEILEDYRSDYPALENSTDVEVIKFISDNEESGIRYIYEEVYENIKALRDYYIEEENNELYSEGLALEDIFSNSEFEKVGSKKQYLEYIKSIFPNSNINHIVYHGTNAKFDKFDKQFFGKETPNYLKTSGFWFTRMKFFAENWGEASPYILNMENPYENVTSPTNPNVANQIKDIPLALKLGHDSAILDIDEGVETSQTITEYVTFNPEQIFRLGTKEDLDNFKKWIKDNQKIVSKIDYLNETLNSIIDPETNELSYLVEDSIRKFDYQDGIKIKILTDGSTFVSKANIEQSQDDPIDDVIESEEESKKESWQDSVENRSIKDTASAKVKRLIRRIPTGEVNELGLDVYVQFDEMYNRVIKDFSNIPNSDRMMDKMEAYSKIYPEYKYLYDTLLDDSNLKTEFFQGVNNSHTPFVMVIENTETNQFRTIEANRRSLDKSIISKWKEDIARDSNLVSEDKSGNQTINTDYASKLLNEAREIVKDIRGEVEINNKDLQRVFDLFNNASMSISMNTIELLYGDGGKDGVRNIISILTGSKGIANVLKQFSNGNNPFEVNIESKYSENKTITYLSNIEKAGSPSLYEDSFRNIDNKIVYSHLITNFISNLRNNLKDKKSAKAILKQYYRDPSFKNNPILQMISNAIETGSDTDGIIDYAISGGLRTDGDGGIQYRNMDARLLAITGINGYFNNGSNKGYVRGPVLSDAPNNILFKVDKMDVSKALDAMVDLASDEYQRIKQIKKQLKDIINGKITDENIIKHLHSEASTKYIIVPMMNGFKGDPNRNEKSRTEAKVLISNWLESRIENYKEKLITDGIISTDKNNIVSYSNSLIDNRIAKSDRYNNFEEFLREYYINDIVYRASLSVITVGDPAMYKPDTKGAINRTIDYQKRAKEIYSPKKTPDVNAKWISDDGSETLTVSSQYRTIYLKDNEIQAPSFEAIKQILTDAGKEHLLGAYEKVNETDAQAYITLDFYAETLVSHGLYSQKHHNAIKRLKRGRGTADDIALVMQPIKPFAFGWVYDDVTEKYYPYQNKNSEFLLLPQMVNSSPKLKNLLKFMTINNIGTANFDSAVKVGLSGVIDTKLFESNTVSSMRPFESKPIDDEKIINVKVHRLNTIDRGIQTDIPDHYVDSDIKFGTQIRKIGVSDLNGEIKYTVNDKEVSSTDLLKIYDSILAEDLKEGYNKLINEFTIVKDGKREINMIGLRDLLLDTARQQGLGEEFEKAIQLNSNGDFILPLAHPVHGKITQQLLTSLFRSRVTDQKINGGAFVQVSSFGYSDNLKIIRNKDGGIKEAQIMLPAWSKKFYKRFVDRSGNLSQESFEKLKKEAPALLDMIGYRIPTEAKYSMLPLRVVGFLPVESGGAVMLPAEITTIAGSDFDVDKLQIMMKAFNEIRKGIDYNMLRDELASSGTNTSFKEIKALYDNIKAKKELTEREQVLKEEIDAIPDFIMEELSMVEYEVPSMDINELYDGEILKSQQEISSILSTLDKKTRDNAKIDIILGVLKNSDTASKILTPGGYDKISIASKYFRTVIPELKQEELELFDMTTTETLAERNNVGKELIGIAANFNAAHAVMQYSNISLNDAVMFDGQNLTKISPQKAVTKVIIDSKGKPTHAVTDNTEFVTDNLAQFLAAVVDNAKDPHAFFLNYNKETANVVSLITALGYDPITAVAFVSQPIVREYVKILKETKNNPAERYASIDNLFRIYDIEDKNEIAISNIDTKELINGLSESIYDKFQANVLIAFDRYRELANSFGNLVTASRADTSGARSSLANVEVFLNKIEKSKEDIELNGVEDLFKYTEDGSNFIYAFTKYGMELPLRFLNKLYPYNNPAFAGVKELIKHYLPTKDFTEKDLNKIYEHLNAYITSKFDYFNQEDASYLFNEFPQVFYKTVKENKELQENKLIKMLHTSKDRDLKIDRITFDTLGRLSKEQQNDIKQAWEDLFNEYGEVGTDIANKLVKYAYINTGLNYGFSGFAHLIPTDFYSKGLKDSKGMSYSDFLYDAYNNESMISEDVYGDDFVVQFLRHMSEDDKFVPKISKDRKNITGTYPSGADANRIKAIYINPDNVKNKNLIPLKDGEYKFSPVIGMKSKSGDIKLFVYNGISNGAFRFVPISKLGIPNVMVEYRRGYSSEDSIYKKNNIKPATGEDIAITTSDTIAKAVAKDKPKKEEVKEAVFSRKSVEKEPTQPQQLQLFADPSIVETSGMKVKIDIRRGMVRMTNMDTNKPINLESGIGDKILEIYNKQLKDINKNKCND